MKKYTLKATSGNQIKKGLIHKIIALCKTIIKCNLSHFQTPNSRAAIFFGLSVLLCLFVCFWFQHPLFWDFTLRCFLQSVLLNFLSNAQSYSLAHRHYLCSTHPHEKVSFLIMRHVTCWQHPLHQAIALWHSFSPLDEAPPSIRPLVALPS